jgi:hypothetical protein
MMDAEALHDAHSNDKSTNEKSKLEPLQYFDYDNLWKTLLRHYFWDGLKIFLPELYDAADREREPTFLDKELEKVTFDLEGGANRTDLLVKLELKKGGSALTLAHVEVQGEGGGCLPLRMYQYKEAIHLLHKAEPVGIAVMTAPRPKKEPHFYSSEQFGVKALYEYVNVDVMKLDDALLLSEGNRVGLVLYALKRARQSGGDEGLKFRRIFPLKKARKVLCLLA